MKIFDVNKLSSYIFALNYKYYIKCMFLGIHEMDNIKLWVLLRKVFEPENSRLNEGVLICIYKQN